MKKLKKQRSVIPVYLVAVVWLVAGFGVRIHRPLQFAVTIAISAAEMEMVTANFCGSVSAVQNDLAGSYHRD